jgi:hypothetical protein
MTLQANLPTRDRVNQIDEMNQTDQIDQTNLSRLPCSESERGEMQSLFHQGNPNVTNVPNDPNDLNDPNVPHMAASTPERVSASSYQRLDASSHSRILASTPLIATEEEVRGFFANYTERYTQKDFDSFISLFSSRAIQNRQDELEGIRKIYGNFLKQSQEIKYDIDNIKIEIYQNGVEVKARYELVQMVKKSGDKRIWRGDIRWSLIKEEGVLKILSLDYQPQKSLLGE